MAAVTCFIIYDRIIRKDLKSKAAVKLNEDDAVEAFRSALSISARYISTALD